MSSILELDTLSLLFGLVKVKYPSFLSNLDFRLTVPFTDNIFSVSVPKFFFKACFYIGIATSCYYLLKYTMKGKSWVWNYLRSFWNDSKYLKHDVIAQDIYD